MRMMMKWSWGSCGGNSLMERSMGIAPLGNTWKNGGFLNCGDQAQIIQLRLWPARWTMFKHNKATFFGFTKHQIHTRQIPQPSANSGFIGVICFKRQFQRRHASEMDANLEKTKTKKCRLFSSEGLPVKMCSRGFHQFHFRPFSNFVLRTSLCLFPCHAGTNRQKDYQTLKKDPLWTEKFRVFFIIIIIVVTCLGPFHFWGHGRE